MSKAKLWSALAAVVTLAACLFPTDTCTCTPVVYEGLIVGFVRDELEAPLSATITSSIRDHRCKASVPGLSIAPSPSVAADSIGRYQFHLIANGADSLCVRLVARRTGLADSVVRDSIRYAPVHDSLRIDFTFP